jgi:hypothetical protein
MATENTQRTEPLPIPSPQPGPVPVPSGEAVHIGEDLDDLEKESKVHTFVVVGVVLFIIAIGVAVISFATRPKPAASGTMDDAFAVALQGDNVLTTIRVTFHNIGGKPLWIRDLKAQLTTADGKQYSDVAASPDDFDRYFRYYPDLRDRTIQPLKVETKVDPGEQVRGSMIVSFPVTLDSFNSRKSLSVMIYPYDTFVAPAGGDQPAVVITKE